MVSVLLDILHAISPDMPLCACAVSVAALSRQPQRKVKNVFFIVEYYFKIKNLELKIKSFELRVLNCCHVPVLGGI